MPKYRVYLETVASTTIQVEAADKDEAYELAASQNVPRICAQCSGWGGSQNLELSDTWDLPQTMSVDDAVEEVEG